LVKKAFAGSSFFLPQTPRVDGEQGDDLVGINGGGGNDAITYDVSEGNDQVFIDGSTGHNALTIQNPVGMLRDLTVVNGQGQVIYQHGTGGTFITVRRVCLTILSPNSAVLYQGCE
jgi:Ca2+-binding RTX toxin-like protein